MTALTDALARNRARDDDEICASCEWLLPAERELIHTRSDGEDVCATCCDVCDVLHREAQTRA